MSVGAHCRYVGNSRVVPHTNWRTRAQARNAGVRPITTSRSDLWEKNTNHTPPLVPRPKHAITIGPWHIDCRLVVLSQAAIDAAVGVLMTPLWVAMSMGFRWAKGRSSEVWRNNTYRRSSCHTYGSCGDDSDIEEEIERFEQREPNVGELNVVRDFYIVHYPGD